MHVFIDEFVTKVAEYYSGGRSIGHTKADTAEPSGTVPSHLNNGAALHQNETAGHLP
jgi:hypothetical protein